MKESLLVFLSLFFWLSLSQWRSFVPYGDMGRRDIEVSLCTSTILKVILNLNHERPIEGLQMKNEV